VRVAVRIRPPVRADEMVGGAAAARESNAVHFSGSTLWLLPHSNADGAGGERQAAARQFGFDWVLGPESTQAHVFAELCEQTRVVDGVLGGVNGCVMAYGQTGAGKTHTLSHLREGDEGIVPRALQLLFARIAAESAPSAASPGAWSVELAYVQIYMEAVYDLLQPANTVEIREAPGEGATLAGHAAVELGSYADALDAMRSGERHRVTASTSLNASSSRSHTVLLLTVRGRQGANSTVGKLYLVDLAGSERVKRSEVTGVAFDEAVAINTSLTCLGRCVAALAANGKAGRPPFRESKLTRLLSSAFGGRSTTVLVVCVAPSRADVSESTNSLQFGAQAMSVRVSARAHATIDHRALAAELLAQLDALEAGARALEAEALCALAPRLAELRALQGAHDSLVARRGALDARAAAAERGRGARDERPRSGGGGGGGGGGDTEHADTPASRGRPSPAADGVRRGFGSERAEPRDQPSSRSLPPYRPLDQRGFGSEPSAERAHLHADLVALDAAIEAAEAEQPRTQLHPRDAAVETAGAEPASDAAAGGGARSPGGAVGSELAVDAAWADVERLSLEKAEAAERFERARQGEQGEADALVAMEVRASSSSSLPPALPPPRPCPRAQTRSHRSTRFRAPSLPPCRRVRSRCCRTWRQISAASRSRTARAAVPRRRFRSS
jgi:hypothetical protein